MPLVALGIAAGVAGGAATAYGAHKAGEAADKAGELSAQANREAIAEQQRQDAQQKFQFDQQQAQAKSQWDATQAQQKTQWDTEQAIRAPYRQAGQVALGHLGDLLGVNFNPALIPQAQPFRPSMSGSAPAAAAPTNAPAVQQLRSLMPQATNNQMSPGSVQLRDANGMVHTFASQAQADAFKQQNGIA